MGDTYGQGIYKNHVNIEVEIGLEDYYRDTRDKLTYKPRADIFLEEFIERVVIQGEAYGLEFSIGKPRGKINWWLNYTWSRSLLRVQSDNFGDRANNHNWFPSDFDCHM